MLSESQIIEAYMVGGAGVAGLRAVEAAVRADQIETDAAIAERAADAGSMIVFSGHRVGDPALLDLAAAIRAQLVERPVPEVIPGTRAALDGLGIRTTERGK